jgi:uncharacterized alkaline shock family protein YloU
MNIFFRIMLAVYAFFMAVISAIMMYLSVSTKTLYGALDLAKNILTGESSTGYRIAIFAVSLVFFILSMMFLLSGARSNKDKRAVSKHTNIGEIRISLNSIENIAFNTSKKVNGIRDSKISVTKLEEGVDIVVRIVIMPDLSIPAISEDLQERVKKAVEETSGVVVKQVKVIVDSIFSGTIYKARVE